MTTKSQPHLLPSWHHNAHSYTASEVGRTLMCSRVPLQITTATQFTPPVSRSPGPHLASPAHPANTSVRRRIGSALLQSPARSGHSTCIRRILDDPLRPPALRQRPRDVIYPPLPNVSRRLSLLRKHDETRKTPPGFYEP